MFFGGHSVVAASCVENLGNKKSQVLDRQLVIFDKGDYGCSEF